MRSHTRSNIKSGAKIRHFSQLRKLKWLFVNKTNTFFKKNAHLFAYIKKKPYLCTRFPKKRDWTESYGAPENFNFWGEREHGENSHERRSRESY